MVTDIQKVGRFCRRK